MKKILIFFVAVSFTVIAQNTRQGLKPVKVDIFKNGNGFFVAEGSLNLSNGEAQITDVPRTAFGTLWVGATDKNIQISGLRASEEKLANRREPSSLYEILLSNIGKQVIFRQSGEKVIEYTGVLERVIGEVSQPVIVLRTAKGTMILNTWYAMHAEFPDSFQNMYSDTTKAMALRIKTNSTHNTARFQMVYFQNQIGWTPSYRIDLIDEKNAQIILSGTVVNDIQDIEKADVNLVVGYPHFEFANTLSPLTTSMPIGDFLSALGYDARRPEFENYGNRMMAAQVARYEGGSGSTDMGNFTPVEGTAVEDLFFYNLPEFSLKKNERAQVNIFSATVPYQHVYEVTLPNAFNIQDGYLYDKTPARKEPYEVWHSIRLENKTTMPWTTGAALTIQNGKALGQDILQYAPAKSTTHVKITTSPDIYVTEEERETERKEDQKKKDGYSYDLVTISGEISLNNYKDKDVKLKITRPITGKLREATAEPKSKLNVKSGSAINPDTVLTWEVNLKKGEARKITYSYEVYLRR